MGPNDQASPYPPRRRAPPAGACRLCGRGLRGALVLLLALALWPAEALAGTVPHVVAKGDTLGSLAKRYGTSVKAIEQVNGLKPARHLYPGQKLLVPCDPNKPGACVAAAPATGGSPKDCQGRSRLEDEENEPDESEAPWICSKSVGGRVMALPRPRQGKAKGQPSHARKPAKPGYVSLLRYGETFRGQLLDANDRVAPTARDRVSRLMRDLRANKERPIDDRLLKQVARVSDHFGGRTIVIVSGYREYNPRQHTRSSRHNVGMAIDFRVVGVPVEEVWEYCLELGGVGVGYYPTSAFVHLDVRGYDAAWVDTSRPGERPVYACRPPRAEQEPAEHRAPTARPPGRPATTARATSTRTGTGSTPPTSGTPNRAPERTDSARSAGHSPKAAPAPRSAPRGVGAATAQSS